MSNAVDLNVDDTATAAWSARFLKARGIGRVFGLQGGHIHRSGITWLARTSAPSMSATKLQLSTWRTRTQN